MNISALSQRFRQNIQTYIIIIALVVNLGSFCHCHKGRLSFATEYIQPVQANDSHFIPGGRHGAGDGDGWH